MAVETSTDLAVFFNTADWGEAATYTAPGGSATSCTVIPDYSVKLIDGDTGEIVGTGTTLAFLVSEIADPARDATVLITSTSVTWVVQEVADRDQNVVVCRVRKQ